MSLQVRADLTSARRTSSCRPRCGWCRAPRPGRPARSPWTAIATNTRRWCSVSSSSTATRTASSVARDSATASGRLPRAARGPGPSPRRPAAHRRGARRAVRTSWTPRGSRTRTAHVVNRLSPRKSPTRRRIETTASPAAWSARSSSSGPRMSCQPVRRAASARPTRTMSACRRATACIPRPVPAPVSPATQSRDSSSRRTRGGPPRLRLATARLPWHGRRRRDCPPAPWPARRRR